MKFCCDNMDRPRGYYDKWIWKSEPNEQTLKKQTQYGEQAEGRQWPISQIGDRDWLKGMKRTLQEIQSIIL